MLPPESSVTSGWESGFGLPGGDAGDGREGGRMLLSGSADCILNGFGFRSLWVLCCGVFEAAPSAVAVRGFLLGLS